MNDPQEQSHSGWRGLDHEWRQAQEGWNDSTTDYFRAEFWEPLEQEMTAYLRRLDQLIETLREAQQVARTR